VLTRNRAGIAPNNGFTRLRLMFICKHWRCARHSRTLSSRIPSTGCAESCLSCCSDKRESGALCLRRKRAHCSSLPRKSFLDYAAPRCSHWAICQSGRRWSSRRLGVDLGPRSDNGQDLFADAGRRGFSAQILRFTLRWMQDFVYRSWGISAVYQQFVSLVAQGDLWLGPFDAGKDRR
jgi:hypothetical protein